LDIKILNDLAISEREDLVRAKEKKERERLEAEEMREIMKQQLELEKQREAELELLYRDEAARSWEMREAEWEKEKLAREALMVEVLAARQQQLEEKKVELMDRRMESIQRREELLKDIEIANQLTAREAEKKCQEKNKIQNELQAQVISRSYYDKLGMFYCILCVYKYCV
jgi:trichoplein keratin filament-binding protein